MSGETMSGPGPADLTATIFVAGKTRHAELPQVAGAILAWAREHRREVILDVPLAPLGGGEGADLSEAAHRVSLVVVLGGDGTILGTARRLGEHRIPILGVNLGGLGFMAETASEDAVAALDHVAAGHYRIGQRMMLDCEVTKEGGETARRTVLNDVVINKGALARIIGIEARVDDDYLTRYRGDGLIVSTPTGSTAYALAAGGSIVYPEAEAVLMTPICPHILTNRPIVIPAEVEVTLSLTDGGEDVTLTLDGQEGMPLVIGDRVLIKRSQRRTMLVHPRGYDFYQVLRRKLKWGEW
jgi:NAD+ kinase